MERSRKQLLAVVTHLRGVVGELRPPGLLEFGLPIALRGFVTELQVVRLIARGWDNARIADELRLGEQTIRNYVSRLYGKIGVRTRAEAVVWARDREMPG